MRHPFSGILPADQGSVASTVKLTEPAPSRRGLLGLLIGFVAGGAGLLAGSQAQAQRVTTLAIGEEGGRHRPTTYAVGEEGGRVTTYAAHDLRVVPSQDQRRWPLVKKVGVTARPPTRSGKRAAATA